jgi:hypothetical protein
MLFGSERKFPMSPRDNKRKPFVALGLTASLFALPFVTAIVFVNSAAASSPTNALVVTGALKGTLKIGPKSTCDASTHGVQLSGFTTSLSSTKYKKWSVTVSVAKPGTYTKFKFGGSSSFALESGGLNAWVATSGTMTIKTSTGTVNLTLGAHEGSATGTVYVKGSWRCKS